MPKRAGEPLSQFNIRMPTSLLDQLDEEVDDQRRLHPGRMFTRSDLIRDVLFEHVNAKKAARKAAKKS